MSVTHVPQAKSLNQQPFSHRRRRSGRSPAWPYPPHRQRQYTMNGKTLVSWSLTQFKNGILTFQMLLKTGAGQ